MKKILIVILLIFSCSSEISPVEDPINIVDPTDPVITVEYGLQEFEVEFQGITRSFNIFVPDSYDPFDAVPLLFCLHAWSSSNEIIMTYTGFNDIASEENFIVVYPQGSYFNGTTHWNVGGWTLGSSVDDVAFIDFLIDAISEDYLIDSERIYSTGMSNGGYMSFLLACQLSEKIAAIASVAGSMTPETFDVCDPQRAISILQIHGTNDVLVPYNGGDGTMAINDVIDYWRGHNSCDSSPTVIDIPDIFALDFSTVQEITYSCDNDDTNTNAMVRHYRVDGGGHDWIGAWGNRDVNASELIWEFFSLYDLNGLID